MADMSTGPSLNRDDLAETAIYDVSSGPPGADQPHSVDVGSENAQAFTHIEDLCLPDVAEYRADGNGQVQINLYRMKDVGNSEAETLYTHSNDLNREFSNTVELSSQSSKHDGPTSFTTSHVTGWTEEQIKHVNNAYLTDAPSTSSQPNLKIDENANLTEEAPPPSENLTRTAAAITVSEALAALLEALEAGLTLTDCPQHTAALQDQLPALNSDALKTHRDNLVNLKTELAKIINPDDSTNSFKAAIDDALKRHDAHTLSGEIGELVGKNFSNESLKDVITKINSGFAENLPVETLKACLERTNTWWGTNTLENPSPELAGALTALNESLKNLNYEAATALTDKIAASPTPQPQPTLTSNTEDPVLKQKKTSGLNDIRNLINEALNPETSALLKLDIRVLLTKAHNSGLIQLTNTEATINAFNKSPSEFDVTVKVGDQESRVQGSLTKYFEACNKLKWWTNTASYGWQTISSSGFAIGAALFALPLSAAASTAAVAGAVAAIGFGVSLLFKNSPSAGGNIAESAARTVRNWSAGVAIGAVGGTFGAPFLLGGAVTAGIGAVASALAHFNSGPRIRSVEDALLETTVRFPTDLETSANLTSEKALVLLLRLYHQIKVADAAGRKHVSLEGRSSFSLQPRDDEANLVATCARPLLEAMQNLVNNWDSMSNDGRTTSNARQEKSIFLSQEFDPKIRQYISTYLPNFLTSLMNIPSLDYILCHWINGSQHNLKSFWQRVQSCRSQK